MIDTSYKTMYFRKYSVEGRDLIDSLRESTDILLLKWERKYDTVANEYYYYSTDPELSETYYFYINTKTIGSLLQVVRNERKEVYEFDDSIYKTELSSLANAIYKLESKSISADSFYNRYNYGSNIPYYKSYKEKKMEKAANQLSGIEPSTNIEYL